MNENEKLINESMCNTFQKILNDKIEGLERGIELLKIHAIAINPRVNRLLINRQKKQIEKLEEFHNKQCPINPQRAFANILNKLAELKEQLSKTRIPYHNKQFKKLDNQSDAVQELNAFIIHIFTFIRNFHPEMRIELEDFRTKAIKQLEKLDGDSKEEYNFLHFDKELHKRFNEINDGEKDVYMKFIRKLGRMIKDCDGHSREYYHNSLINLKEEYQKKWETE